MASAASSYSLRCKSSGNRAAFPPFRSEKDTNWEGAFRIPLLVRWPGKVPAGVVSNEIVHHHDWLPTFLAMAGEPDIVEKCKNGSTLTATTCFRT
jgi:arylsulfatase A-like enzyme